MSGSNQFLPAISAVNKNAFLQITDAGAKDIRSIKWSYMDTAATPVFSKYTDIFQGRLIVMAGNVDVNVAGNLLTGSTQTVQSILGGTPIIDLDLSDPFGEIDFPKEANQGQAGAIQGETLTVILVAPQAWNGGVKRVSSFVGKLVVQATERFGRK